MRDKKHKKRSTRTTIAELTRPLCSQRILCCVARAESTCFASCFVPFRYCESVAISLFVCRFANAAAFVVVVVVVLCLSIILVRYISRCIAFAEHKPRLDLIRRIVCRAAAIAHCPSVAVDSTIKDETLICAHKLKEKNSIVELRLSSRRPLTSCEWNTHLADMQIEVLQTFRVIVCCRRGGDKIKFLSSKNRNRAEPMSRKCTANGHHQDETEATEENIVRLIAKEVTCVSYAPFSFHPIFSVRFCLVSDKFIAQHFPSLMKSILITKSRRIERPSDRHMHTLSLSLAQITIHLRRQFDVVLFSRGVDSRPDPFCMKSPTDAHTHTKILSVRNTVSAKSIDLNPRYMPLVGCVRVSHGNRFKSLEMNMCEST